MRPGVLRPGVLGAGVLRARVLGAGVIGEDPGHAEQHLEHGPPDDQQAPGASRQAAGERPQALPPGTRRAQRPAGQGRVEAPCEAHDEDLLEPGALLADLKRFQGRPGLLQRASTDTGSLVAVTLTPAGPVQSKQRIVSVGLQVPLEVLDGVQVEEEGPDGAAQCPGGAAGAGGGGQGEETARDAARRLFGFVQWHASAALQRPLRGQIALQRRHVQAAGLEPPASQCTGARRGTPDRTGDAGALVLPVVSELLCTHEQADRSGDLGRGRGLVRRSVHQADRQWAGH